MWRILLGTIIMHIFIQDVDSAENCYVGYNFGNYYGYCVSCYGYITCEHGCCGNTCCSAPCVNRLSLALGLIFGLIGFILFCSGFVICFVQYVYRNKKKVPTRDSYAQTGDPNRGTIMAPTPLPPTFLLQKKNEKKTETEKIKVAIVTEENNK